MVRIHDEFIKWHRFYENVIQIEIYLKSSSNLLQFLTITYLPCDYFGTMMSSEIKLGGHLDQPIIVITGGKDAS